MPLKRKGKKKEAAKPIVHDVEIREDTFSEDPVKRKLSFDDLSPTKRASLLSSPKHPILLYCRVRPQLPNELAKKELPSLHIIDDHTLMSLAPEESFTFKSNKRGFAQSSQHFYFNRVFGPDSTQHGVFTESIVNMLKDFLDGQNCLVFSYGVTNSGKTHTIHGSQDDPGILPRVLDSVFASLGDKLYEGDQLKPKNYCEIEWLSGDRLHKEKAVKDKIFSKALSMDGSVSSSAWSSMASTFTISNDVTTCSTECTQHNMTASTTVPETSVIDIDMPGSVVGVWVSCAEIYNEFIYDLFTEVPTGKRTKEKGPRPVLRCAEDSSSNVFIKGLTEVQVKSVEEAKVLAAYGQYNRKIGSTVLNQKSSRSHCVFMIKMVRMADSRRPKQAIVNRLSIVDLAGSERSRKTQASGSLIREAGNINVSLHILGKCINAMRNNTKRERTCIPFRESKLTQIFQNYFVGKGRGTKEGKVMMFVNVSPSPVVFDETIKVLEISSIASKVVPYTRSVRGGPCGGVVGIENVGDSPMPEPTSVLPECEVTKCDGDGDGGSPRPGAPVVAFVTPGPAGGLLSFQGQPCTHCEQYKSIISDLKTQVVDLTMKIWDLEHTVRGEVCKEFQEQIAEIEDQHNVGLAEQAEEIESMYEKRLQLLTQSIKRNVHRKKRKLEEAEFCETEYSVLQDRIADLEAKVSAKDEELKEAHNNLKKLMLKYESNMVDHKVTSNDTALKAAKLEKKVLHLEEEVAAKSKEAENKGLLVKEMERQNKEMKREFEDLEDLYGSLQEVHTHLEEDLERYKANLSEARSALKDMTDMEAHLEDLTTNNKKMEKKLEQVQAENTALQERLAALTSSMEELRTQSAQKESDLQSREDSRRQAAEGQLDQVRRQLSDMEKQLALEQEHNKIKEEALKEKDKQLEELSAKSVSVDQVTILEHKLEKVQAVETALKDERLMMKVKLNEQISSSKREIATLTASYELQLGELKSKMHDLSMQLNNKVSGQSLQPSSSGLCLVLHSEGSDENKKVTRKPRRNKRAGTKRCVEDNSHGVSESSSDGSLKSVSSTSSLKTAHHVDGEEPPSTVKEDQHVDEEEEHIYDDPCSLLEDNDSGAQQSLPNIDRSSQLIEPDKSDVSRAVIDVTYAKMKKSRRKRMVATKTKRNDNRVQTPASECHSNVDNCSSDGEDDYSPPKKSKRNFKLKKGKEQQPLSAVEKTPREQDSENTPKEKGSIKKKLGRIISKSAAARKVTGKRLVDSTNTPEQYDSEEGLQRLSKTAGSRKKVGIRKSQISGPLELMDSPEVTAGHKTIKHSIPMNWDLRRRQAVNYAT